MKTSFTYNDLQYAQIGDKYGFINPNLPGALKYHYWEISAKEYYHAERAYYCSIAKTTTAKH